jgi:hypothetical protein
MTIDKDKEFVDYWWKQFIDAFNSLGIQYSLFSMKWFVSNCRKMIDMEDTF